jgi:hypothetical protein
MEDFEFGNLVPGSAPEGVRFPAIRNLIFGSASVTAQGTSELNITDFGVHLNNRWRRNGAYFIV